MDFVREGLRLENVLIIHMFCQFSMALNKLMLVEVGVDPLRPVDLNDRFQVLKKH